MIATRLHLSTRSASAALPNGLRLPYIEHGDPGGVPLVLLHGYSDSMRSYEPLLAHLPHSFRALAPSQRGHGDASTPASGYAPGDFAADLELLLDELAIESAVVVGHSMGSTIAQQFALDHPDRLSGLVLMGSFVDFAGNPGVGELESAVASLTDPVGPAFIREFQQSTLAAPVPDEFFATILAESAKLTTHTWRLALEGMLATNLAAELGRIDAPTLVMWGDQDLFSPRAEQGLLASRIPNARLSICEGGGHAFHWENPARVAAEIAAFITTSVPST